MQPPRSAERRRPIVRSYSSIRGFAWPGPVATVAMLVRMCSGKIRQAANLNHKDHSRYFK